MSGVQTCALPIFSTSIRSEQATFLKLHERLGFIVRGAIAYKRIIPKEKK